MPFLSRRHGEPHIRFVQSDLQLAGPKVQSPSLTPRNRAVSDTVFRRVSMLFGSRKRTRSKPPPLQSTQCRNPVGSLFSRSSSDSTPPSSPEIRRPSGLGRRASDMESIGRPGGDMMTLSDRPRTFLRSPTRLTNFHEVFPLPLPPEIIATALSCLRRRDLAATALVSRGFCSVTRHILYSSLDFGLLTEPQLEGLCATLASHRDLAERVSTLICCFWPRSRSVSADGHALPSPEFLRALQNMQNLQVLTMQSFAVVLQHLPSLSCSLTELTILDESLSQTQLMGIRTWLARQSRLQSLCFPNLLEFCATSGDSVSSQEESVSRSPSIRSIEDESSEDFLPRLQQLHAPTSAATTLLSEIKRSLQRVTLSVHDMLYTGLRPATVLRAMKGTKELHVIFGHEVDRRTAEKFLGMAGSILVGECLGRKEVLELLHVEVLWEDEDAAEKVYKIITSIISRFCGLRRLKLTTPRRSTQTLVPMLLSFPLPPGILNLPSPAPTVTSACTQLTARNPAGGIVMKEFVVCGNEKTHAKAWSKQCPTLNDIQFDFSASTTEVDVELCGVWFRRKVSTRVNA